MSNYNDKLNELIKKYSLFPQIEQNDYRIHILSIKVNRMPKDSKIAVWGAGVHTNKLFEALPSLIDRIDCIIDNSSTMHGKKILGKIIYSPSCAKNIGIDYIIISSFSYRKEIVEYIRENEFKCEYIDIYEINDILHLHEIPFYHMDDYHNYLAYNNLYILRKLYQKEETIELKERYLRELISQYLQIRDFVYAIKYINEYIYNNFIDSKLMQEFLDEINQLFDMIRQDLSSLNGNHISMIIIDSLRAKDIALCDKRKNKMPYLRYLANNSINFTNAFSTSTYTRTCVRSMFTGKLPFAENGYKKNMELILVKVLYYNIC